VVAVENYCMAGENTVKSRFIVSAGGPEKERWIRENDRCGSLYKMNKNSHIYICVFTTESKNVHQWYYFQCEVQFALLIFKKVINPHLLSSTFLFSLSKLMTFAWSLMVVSWPYMNALIDWNNSQANKKHCRGLNTRDCVLHYAKARIDSHQWPLTTLTDTSDCQPPLPSKPLPGSLDELKVT
jgi:hypothetical protein